jgi:hypothetical protein
MKRTIIPAAVLAGVAALTLGATAASAAPTHWVRSRDALGCHVAYEISKHGLSGVPIPAAEELADLQVTAVRGTKPYSTDAKSLVHQIANNRPFKKADQRMVKACGKHH